MTALDAISIGSLFGMGAIALVMIIECRRLCGLARIICDRKGAAPDPCVRDVENMELRSALRAEKAHVQQLQRKLVLLQALPAAE